MTMRLKSASDIRQNMETYKAELERKAKEFVVESISHIYRAIESAHKNLDYSCSVRLGAITNFDNPVVKKMYSDAFTALLGPLGYQFNLHNPEGITHLDVHWKETFDYLKKPLR